MFFDKFTEAITHFIGQFEVLALAERTKIKFERFENDPRSDEEVEELSNAVVNIAADIDQRDFQPDVPFKDKPLEIVDVPEASLLQMIPIRVDIPSILLNPHSYIFSLPPMSSGGGRPHFEIDPPGSVSVVAQQHIFLQDNDYAGVGGHGLKLTYHTETDTQLQSMLAQADGMSPFTGLVPTEMGLAEFAIAARQSLEDWPVEQSANTFTLKATAIEGTYVNGELLAADAEPPSAKDHVDVLKEEEAEEEEASSEDGETVIGVTVEGQGDLIVEASVSLEAGGNTLINSATIQQSWATSGVLAVVGDHQEMNAIVQINGCANNDNLTTTMNDWLLETSRSEGSFNIAMFKHMTGFESEDGGEEAEVESGFPSYWAITRIDGDLTIVNSLTQCTFMTDNDVTVLSSSGVKTTVTAGGNIAFNDISIEELGLYYDLIVVGGNVYDLNMILQLNLLVDNDLVGAVEGFETTGNASFASGDNLTWNQAAIIEVGGMAAPEALTDGYARTAEWLADGKEKIDKDVMHDSPFAGVDVLRVLYISGDVLNVNYINQVNLAGDNDAVALAMNEYMARSDAEWTIGTGGNQLVNFATIVDVEGSQKTYVGGNSYSDEILVQGNLLDDVPYLSAGNPDQIVNEAIAFLDDDCDLVLPDDDAGGATIVPNASQADVMQSMLA